MLRYLSGPLVCNYLPRRGRVLGKIYVFDSRPIRHFHVTISQNVLFRPLSRWAPALSGEVIASSFAALFPNAPHANGAGVCRASLRTYLRTLTTKKPKCPFVTHRQIRWRTEATCGSPGDVNSHVRQLQTGR